MTSHDIFARAALLAALTLSACSGPVAQARGPALADLRATHERLHRELEARVSRDPVAARVFADPGQIVLLARPAWVEELLGRVAEHYLHEVTLDLDALTGQAKGTVRANTFLGRVKLGDWRLEFEIVALSGVLSAGRPSLSFRAQDELGLDLPVQVRRAPGRIALRFHWDSAAVANLVCKDFEVDRELAGVVLPQTHRLEGTVRFRFEDGAIVAIPHLESPRIPLRVDLAPDSWSTVRQALQAQDSVGRCGALLHPEEVVARLRALADRGIGVRLPDSLVRPFRLPTTVEGIAGFQNRNVEIAVASSRLVLSPRLLWSSATLRVEQARPGGAASLSGGLRAARLLDSVEAPRLPGRARGLTQVY